MNYVDLILCLLMSYLVGELSTCHLLYHHHHQHHRRRRNRHLAITNYGVCHQMQPTQPMGMIFILVCDIQTLTNWFSTTSDGYGTFLLMQPVHSVRSF